MTRKHQTMSHAKIKDVPSLPQDLRPSQVEASGREQSFLRDRSSCRPACGNTLGPRTTICFWPATHCGDSRVTAQNNQTRTAQPAYVGETNLMRTVIQLYKEVSVAVEAASLVVHAVFLSYLSVGS